MNGEQPDRNALIRTAFRLEWLTVGWMSIEAVVAIGSGAAANSLSLTAFDSVIELISGGVLIWRLTVELRRGQAFPEAAERLASRIGGGLLLRSRSTSPSRGWGASGRVSVANSRRRCRSPETALLHFCAAAPRRH